MSKKVIVKISEGLGNQLFMYANGYSLKKKYNVDLFIDHLSGYYHKKKIYNFLLNNLNISTNYASGNYIFDTPLRNLLKKYYIFIDKFKTNKKFYFEKKNKNKSTYYLPIDFNNTDNLLFLDGNFESEKYFLEFRKELLNEFKFKNTLQFSKNNFLKIIKNSNVVSICVRQNRFSERLSNKNSSESINKSNLFLKNTIDYIYRAKSFFEKKIDNPLFLVWSNDFTNLDNYLPKDKFIYVVNKENKILSDFYLLTQCKYFIVGPSTFHWWGAWISNFENKICLRPKNINVSNNIDFWPEQWISI